MSSPLPGFGVFHGSGSVGFRLHDGRGTLLDAVSSTCQAERFCAELIQEEPDNPRLRTGTVLMIAASG